MSSDKDPRFSDQTWTQNPMYRALHQTYNVWRDSLLHSVDGADLPPRDAARARFALSQAADALAPTNTLAGNPAALRKLFETGGGSAVRGMTNFLEDLARNGGMPSQVDMSAFQVGKNLALTPGAVVFRNDVLELIQYAPSTPTVYSRPVLAVPPQINKYYVLDLAPGKSLLQYLVSAGLQTFTISWRNPTPAQRDWGLDTYAAAILDAVDAVRDITGSPDLNAIGACSGGITLALVLGHLAAISDRRINAATLLVTALDGAADSQLGVLAMGGSIEAARLASRQKGVLEGSELARAFAWLRPNDLVWRYWVSNYLLGEDPPAFDILYWNNDTTNLPARLHSEFLDLLETRALSRGGRMKLLDTPIDLKRVDMDTFVVGGVTDHITPWQACFAATQLLGGTSEFVLSSSGHVQSLLNPPGNPKSRYFLNEHHVSSADDWRTGAKEHAGSWWDPWRTWLTNRSSDTKPAPPDLGSARYPVLAPAPGTYVNGQ